MRSSLLDWSRPAGILLESELPRLDQWLELYQDQLEVHATDPRRPTSTEKLLIRSIAAQIWRYDRSSGDAAALQVLVEGKRSWAERRRNAFVETEARIRLRELTIADITQTQELLDVTRKAISGENLRDPAPRLRLMGDFGGE